MNDVNYDEIEDMKSCLSHLNEKFCVNLQSLSSLILQFENVFEFVETGIELRIESLKMDVDGIENELKKDVTIVHKKAVNLLRSRAAVIKRLVQKLKNSSYKRVLKLESNMKFQKHKIDKILRFKYQFQTYNNLYIKFIHIGRLIQPFVCEYRKINSSKAIETIGKMVGFVSLFDNERKFIIYDTIFNIMKLYDLNGDYLYSSGLKQLINSPSSMCTSVYNEIYIADANYCKIFTLNANFEIIGRFNITKTPTYITIDEDNDKLYATHQMDSVVSIWNTLDQSYIDEFQVEMPYEIKVKYERIYINCCDYSIKIINKQTYDTINTIRLNHSFIGLYIDDHMNIITLSYSYCEDFAHYPANKKHSYLHLFDKNGTNLNKVQVSDEKVQDILVFDRKILLVNCCGSAKLLEFE